MAELEEWRRNFSREHTEKECWCGHGQHRADPMRDYRELFCIQCRLEARPSTSSDSR